MTGSESFEVRRAGLDDARWAVRTVRDVKRHGSDEPPVLRSAPQMCTWLSDEKNVLLVAAEGARPIGLALGYLLVRVDVARPMLFFYEIEVVADRRRRGVGRALVEAMKDVARQENVVRMWVQTSPDNVPARALYRSAGGVEREGTDLLYVWTNVQDA